MEGNVIEVGDLKIKVPGNISAEFNSPFNDATELVFRDNSFNPKGAAYIPFTINGSADINRAFGYKHLLQKGANNNTVDNVRLYSQGHLIDTGKLKFEQIPRNINNGNVSYNLTFYNEIKGFIEKVKGKKLNGLEMNGKIFPTAGYTIESLIEFLEDFFADPAVFDTGTLSEPLSQIANRKASSTFMYFYLTGTSYLDPVANFWKDYVINGDDYIAFPSVYVEGEGDGVPRSKIINKWDSANQKFDTYDVNILTIGLEDVPNYTPRKTQIVPMYYYHQVLRHCFSENGYTLEGDILNDADFGKLLLFNAHGILDEHIMLCTNYNESGQNVYPLYTQYPMAIEPKNHLWDMEIGDFVADFCLKFNCYITINGSRAIITQNKLEKINRAIDKSIINPNIMVKPDDNTGVKLSYDLQGEEFDAENKVAREVTTLPDNSNITGLNNDDYFIDYAYNAINRKDDTVFNDYEYLCSNVIPYTSGYGKEYSMQVYPVQMGVFNYPQGSTDLQAFMPIIRQQAGYKPIQILEYADVASSSSTRHLLERVSRVNDPYEKAPEITAIGFYHGLENVLDYTSDDYPYMSAHNWAPQSSGPHTQLGNWSLAIVGNEGLIATFWRDMVRVYNNARLLIVRVKMPITELLKLKWNESYVVLGSKYYLSVVRFDMPVHGQAELEFWDIS